MSKHITLTTRREREAKENNFWLFGGRAPPSFFFFYSVGLFITAPALTVDDKLWTLFHVLRASRRMCLGLVFVGRLTSQKHASVSQGRICLGSCTCSLSWIEAVDQTCYHTILTPGQPVPALTLERQTPGCVATGVPVFKPLVWLDVGPYAPQGSRKLLKWSRCSKSVLQTLIFTSEVRYSRSIGEVKSNRVTSSLLRKWTRLPTHACEVGALTL